MHRARFWALLLLIGGMAAGGDKFPHSVGNECKHRAPAASAPKVKVVLKPIPIAERGKVSGDQQASNEITRKEDEVAPYLAADGDMDAVPCHDPASGVEVSIAETDDADSWKTRVIIGCTVAAAVEVIIIIVIIAYWREIRWTMRKIACPCDEHPSRHGDHEAMAQAGSVGHVMRAAPETHDLLTHHVDAEGEVEGQTFMHPARSRTQEALDDVISQTTHV